MVKALHKAGIEVILDVVFNHTGEGNHEGPTISFRGLDNSIYYHLEPYDKQYYMNYSGCGNTFNCNHPLVEKFIVECLALLGQRDARRRLPLRPRLDPVARPGRRADGRPAGPLEHRARQRAGRDQDHRRGLGRRRPLPGRLLPRAAAGPSGTAATATTSAASSRATPGSSPRSRRGSPAAPTSTRPTASCRSTASTSSPPTTASRSTTSSRYNGKHNEANGEDNRDGTDDNLSWNCGVEGDTDDPEIEALRCRQVKNFLAILMLSQGVPMMVMGDEVAPDPVRQQQRLLPGQRDHLVRLGARRRARGPGPVLRAS